MHPIIPLIVRNDWYIDPSFAEAMGPLILNLLKGAEVELPVAKVNPLFILSLSTSNAPHLDKQLKVAVINVHGALLKRDQFCGPSGMDTLSSMVNDCDCDDSIGAIILDFDTPGGTVAGTASFGETIASCRKPTIAFINEMACSAGYWLASQCSEIIASTARARVGSIGVMLAFADVQPMWEKEGVEFHEIYSSLSADKNRDYAELRKRNYDGYRKDVLDPLASDFIAVVKSKRSISDESIFRGRVVFASEGLENGMIDSIKSWDETLSHAFELAGNANVPSSIPLSTNAPHYSNASSSLLTKTTFSMKEKFPRTAAITGLDSFESTDDGVHLQPDALESIEAALSDAEGERAANDALRQTFYAQAASIADLEASIAQRNARIGTLEAENASIRAAAGASSATIIAESDSDDEDDDDALLARINASPDTNERMALLVKHGYVTK